MANADAFNSGFDAGMGKKSKKKKSKKKKSELLKQPTPAGIADPSAYKKGGKVKKTGVALVHKGERVLTAKQAKKKAYGRKRVAGKK
jgi:hypothetical protein